MTSRTPVSLLLLAAVAFGLLAASPALSAAPPATPSSDPGTAGTVDRIWQRFSANFVEGLAGRTGGLLAAQVGQQIGDGIARVAQHSSTGILSSGLGAILGPAIGQFLGTAAFQLGTRWALNRYRESSGTGEVKSIDLGEVLLASLGSAVGGAVFSAMLGPTMGRFVGGWLGYNLVSKLFEMGGDGKRFDLASSLKSFDLRSAGIGMTAIASAQGLARWLVPSPLLASPVGLMVTILVTSMASTLSNAICETAKESETGTGGLEARREAMAAAYERYVTLQNSRTASAPEFNWAFIDYHRARSAYNDAIAESVSVR